MTAEIDQHFLATIESWRTRLSSNQGGAIEITAGTLLTYFDAQIQSRHLDFAARWLQGQGQGFYTIGSSGHESNAAVAMALRPSDPALLHYRSGGFFAARAAQVEGVTPIRDVLAGMASSIADPISGGRHKVFGHHRLGIIPQTSTIGSHLPRAVGIAFALERATRTELKLNWPADAVVVTSFGDASANHSTVVGALNSAAYCAHRGVRLPLLIVCEDNGIGISTISPKGWVSSALSRYDQLSYVAADGADPEGVLTAARDAVARVRTSRTPTILHLRTVRFMGHAGSDFEMGYRTRNAIARDYDRDPLLATAELLIARGILTPDEVIGRYEAMRAEVLTEAGKAAIAPRLESAAEVVAPLFRANPEGMRDAGERRPTDAARRIDRTPPEEQGSLTLAQSINAALADVLATWPKSMIFGEDVAIKGGVYGVTRGLQKRFGDARVFDTILDEQTILGTALGAAVSGLLPIVEIQYLAYLHNAEDQLRGEAATLAFFSNGQYANGMVVRIAGLAYQKGFGGHFHNDNSIAVLRDIPGLIVAVPSHPAQAPDLLRACIALAQSEGKVCVFLEPIARYHTRDLHTAGDEKWTADYAAVSEWVEPSDLIERAHRYRDGADLLLVTFGNGVFLSLRAAESLATMGISCTVLDLRWLAPLPEADLIATASSFDRLLIVDETRRSGGVSEGIGAVLRDARYPGDISRVTSRDSVIPLGPAADTVLLSEHDIVTGALSLLGYPTRNSDNPKEVM